MSAFQCPIFYGRGHSTKWRLLRSACRSSWRRLRITESGGTAIGFGKDDNPFFWIGDNERVGEGTHVAFTVESRAEVDAFHAAALAAGGRDNGGLRPNYGPNYYAAFVFDPDGANIEAVCHKAE